MRPAGKCSSILAQPAAGAVPEPRPALHVGGTGCNTENKKPLAFRTVTILQTAAAGRPRHMCQQGLPGRLCVQGMPSIFRLAHTQFANLSRGVRVGGCGDAWSRAGAAGRRCATGAIRRRGRATSRRRTVSLLSDTCSVRLGHRPTRTNSSGKSSTGRPSTEAMCPCRLHTSRITQLAACGNAQASPTRHRLAAPAVQQAALPRPWPQSRCPPPQSTLPPQAAHSRAVHIVTGRLQEARMPSWRMHDLQYCDGGGTGKMKRLVCCLSCALGAAAAESH